MQSEINKILQLKSFFHVLTLNDIITKYSLKESSKILLNNIYIQWLTSIWQKTDKHFPIYVKSMSTNIINEKNIPLGYMDNIIQKYENNSIIEHQACSFLPTQKSTLKLNIILPQSGVMQYFLQWQRYRKYWWSTITTTPGLFSLNDIKYGEIITDVDVLAHLPWGEQAVENINISRYQDIDKKAVAKLESTMTLEGALFTLLMDGFMNQTMEEYLRLNRTMAPYKLAFALDYKDENTKNSLIDLANLLNHKIRSNEISTWLPDFSLPLKDQLKLSRQIGVSYTAVISNDTLSNGIFHLMNSSTMLMEQIHVADFDSYTKLLCQ